MLKITEIFEKIVYLLGPPAGMQRLSHRIHGKSSAQCEIPRMGGNNPVIRMHCREGIGCFYYLIPVPLISRNAVYILHEDDRRFVEFRGGGAVLCLYALKIVSADIECASSDKRIAVEPSEYRLTGKQKRFFSSLSPVAL